jgi:hypothetical protein
MHQAAIADGRQDRREGEVEAHDTHAEITVAESHGRARAKEDFVEGAGIFPQCRLVFGATVEIVEDGARQAAVC